jgi:hypothetical protein
MKTGSGEAPAQASLVFRRRAFRLPIAARLEAQASRTGRRYPAWWLSPPTRACPRRACASLGAASPMLRGRSRKAPAVPNGTLSERQASRSWTAGSCVRAVSRGGSRSSARRIFRPRTALAGVARCWHAPHPLRPLRAQHRLCLVCGVLIRAHTKILRLRIRILIDEPRDRCWRVRMTASTVFDRGVVDGRCSRLRGPLSLETEASPHRSNSAARPSGHETGAKARGSRGNLHDREDIICVSGQSHQIPQGPRDRGRLR